MSRNSQTNGMDSIGKQVTLGGHSAVEQPADVPASEDEAGDLRENDPKASRRLTRGQITLRRFLRNRTAVVGAIGFFLVAGFAIFEAVLYMIQYAGSGIGLGMMVLPGIILLYLNTREVKSAFGIGESSTIA